MEYAVEYRKGERWNQNPDRLYKYMECRLCGQFSPVSEDTTSTVCHECVMEMTDPPEINRRGNTGKPSGWHRIK